MASQSSKNADGHGDGIGLTSTQTEVLRLLAKGMKRKEIAGCLSLSVHTVNTHVEKAYEKLYVHTAAGAAAKLMGGGIPRKGDEQP